MIEEDSKLHVFIASPPTVFDAAVILRTLYAGLGVGKWHAYIVGVGPASLPRLVLESRLPINVAEKHVVMGAPSIEDSDSIVVVDSNGPPVWGINVQPKMIIVDYTGTYTRHLQKAVHASGLGLPMLTYEAITVIYELYLRKNVPKLVCENAFSIDPRKGLYIAKKALEALTLFDNYPVLEPNTLVYMLRHVYLSEGYILDPVSYRVEVNPVTGEVNETIEAMVYQRKTFKAKGVARIVYDGLELRISDWRGDVYKILVDHSHGVACVAPGLTVKGSKGEPLQEDTTVYPAALKD